MFWIPEDAKIYFLSKPTKLIKGINGLTSIVFNEVKIEPGPGIYFLFCNLKKNYFKILYTENGYFAIWHKRFEGTLQFNYSGNIVVFSKNTFRDFLSRTRCRRFPRLKK